MTYPQVWSCAHSANQQLRTVTYRYVPLRAVTYPQVWSCAHSANQQWAVRSVPGGSQVYNQPSGKCLTAVSAPGTAVGLDAGVTIVAAQMQPCEAAGTSSQTFTLANCALRRLDPAM